MEAFDKLQAREQQRLSKSILDPVVVNSMNDIKRVIAEFDPSNDKEHSPLPVSTVLESRQEDGKQVQYSVSANTKSKSKRQILLEGFDLIKNRQEMADTVKQTTEKFEVNGKPYKPAQLHSNTNGMSWIDPLITQWFGGKRDVMLITWDIGDGYEYRYDIYTHSLTRAKQCEG
ncbi:hypothetical protein N9045_02495 [bacterium]|nr:hypothetical protein [bacterium]